MLSLIKFGSEWCNPCKAITPILEEIKDTITIIEYDVDITDTEILQKYKVRNIPLLILEIDDKEVWRHVGSISKDVLKNKIKEFQEKSIDLE